jgi:hypothetical protein
LDCAYYCLRVDVNGEAFVGCLRILLELGCLFNSTQYVFALNHDDGPDLLPYTLISAEPWPVHWTVDDDGEKMRIATPHLSFSSFWTRTTTPAIAYVNGLPG